MNNITFTYLNTNDKECKFTVFQSSIVNNMSLIKESKSFNDSMILDDDSREVIIPLNNFTVESIDKFKEYLNGYKSHKSKYNYGDLELAKYLGYDDYTLDLVVILSETMKYTLSETENYALVETILEYKFIQYTSKEVIKYISKLAIYMDEYHDILDNIFRNPTIKDKYIDNKQSINSENAQMTMIINKISSDDLIFMIKNFYAHDHYVATYVYIKLLEKALKICGPDLAQLFVNFRDNSMLFCKNVYKLYNFNDNNNLKIICKALLFGKRKRIDYVYYNDERHRVFSQPTYLDLGRVARFNINMPGNRGINGPKGCNGRPFSHRILKIKKCQRCNCLYQ